MRRLQSSGRTLPDMRYRGQMQQPAPKLTVRRETLRALDTLELTRVVGKDSGAFNCGDVAANAIPTVPCTGAKPPGA
jgi:hypothetical protein